MHFFKWLYPGMKFKRWLSLFAAGVLLTSIGLTIVFNYKYIDGFEDFIFKIAYSIIGSYNYTVINIVGFFISAIGILIMLVAMRMTIRSIITVLLPDNSDKLVDLIYEKRKLDKGPAITVIGGGTGLSVLLRGLKEATNNVTAVVTVADDGGSSGRLRHEFNIIPPGDLRNCLVALADTEPLMEKLFQYRFEGDSELAGHSFGNLFIAAMTQVTGDVEKALMESSKVLAVRGRVFPASTAKIKLNATMTDGTIVEGESQIPLAHKQIKRVHISPNKVEPVASSINAIKDANVIILGQGSLYTSIMPNFLVDKVADTVKKSKAIKIYICNVMTQPGETDKYTVSMHVKAILEHAGVGSVDYVLVNDKPISKPLQDFYAKKGQYPVIIDEDAIHDLGVGFVKADLINETNVIHHDSEKLAHNIMQMAYGLKTDSKRKKRKFD